jgi:integrase/recombinase XerD
VSEPPFLSEFAKHLALERGLAHNTCLAYASDLADYLKWLDGKNPLQADARLLEDFLWYLKSERKLKAASIFRKMEALRAFYKFQAAEERIGEDPTRNFKAPHLPERLPKFLTIDEIERLLRIDDEGKLSLVRTRTILELLYATGMRASELLKLRTDYVNLEEGWVRVMGKGSKERMIPMHSRASGILVRYMTIRERHFGDKTTSPEVFVGKTGKPLSRVQLWRDLKDLGRRAGLKRPLHPHLLRHTFASHLLQGGADMRSVQEMLGHANLQTTQIYTHVDKSVLKETHRRHHPRS